MSVVTQLIANQSNRRSTLQWYFPLKYSMVCLSEIWSLCLKICQEQKVDRNVPHSHWRRIYWFNADFFPLRQWHHCQKAGAFVIGNFSKLIYCFRVRQENTREEHYLAPANIRGVWQNFGGDKQSSLFCRTFIDDDKKVLRHRSQIWPSKKFEHFTKNFTDRKMFASSSPETSRTKIWSTVLKRSTKICSNKTHFGKVPRHFQTCRRSVKIVRSIFSFRERATTAAASFASGSEARRRKLIRRLSWLRSFWWNIWCQRYKTFISWPQTPRTNKLERFSWPAFSAWSNILRFRHVPSRVEPFEENL